MVIVDVGANRGTMTTWFREAGAEVWAIEPDPRCYEDLCRAATPERVLQMAVGATTGTTTLYRSKAAEHNSLYPENVLQGGVVDPIEVPLTTLDDLQASGALPARIDAIKVDAQGAEVAILQGATRLTATQRPLWYLEIWPMGLGGAGTSAAGLVGLLQSLQYVPEGEDWEHLIVRLRDHHGHSAYDALFRAA